MNLRDLSEDDMDLTVWRYMPFSKYISLLTYQALWFSKLKILEDKFEGMMPPPTKKSMQSKFDDWKKVIPPNLHCQLDQMAPRNEQDSRELLVVSCWFLDESESERMWNEYGGGSESVAIRSTIGKLISAIAPHYEDETHIGRVKYVDFNSYSMDGYKANQGVKRAFIKDNKYQHESELRIVTKNRKSTFCVRPNGKLYTESDIQGKNMNNFERPGLYIAVNIPQLISEIIISPTAGEWLYLLISRISEMSKLNIPVSYSELSQA
jgi:hypothetical protein